MPNAGRVDGAHSRQKTMREARLATVGERVDQRAQVAVPAAPEAARHRTHAWK
jgi:hypothetical protein